MRRVGGAAVSDHLAVVAKRIGKPVVTSAPPPLPEAASRAWSAFVELSSARQATFSVQPIPYSEILAYQQVTHWSLTGWEVDQIRSLDDLYLKTVAEMQKSQRGRPQ